MGNIKIVRGVFDTKLELEHAGVAAGFPSPADDYRHETLDFNRDYIRHPEASFYGDVEGDSMRDAGLLDGDRVFYSLGQQLQYKPAASVVVCRRGGASAAFDRLNKYFTIMNMPVVSSQYWNMVYGQTPGQVKQDEEGMQTMRTLGRNMAWMIKTLNVAEDGHPQKEQPVWTNFIR